MLDKVVPGYYYRHMENGDICMSTCCNNTASEHAMCERLVIDDIVHWAKDYKVATYSKYPHTKNAKSVQNLINPILYHPTNTAEAHLRALVLYHVHIVQVLLLYHLCICCLLSTVWTVLLNTLVFTSHNSCA